MGNSDYTIGVAGVGRMGANVARHLKDEGFSIAVVHDVRSEVAKALAGELGINASDTLAGVTQAADYIIEGMTEGVVVMTPGSPEFLRFLTWLRSIFQVKEQDSS